MMLVELVFVNTICVSSLHHCLCATKVDLYAQYNVLGIIFQNNSQSIAFILYMKYIIDTDSVVYVAFT